MDAVWIVSLWLLLTCSRSNAVDISEDDTKRQSCLQRRNITIIFGFDYSTTDYSALPKFWHREDLYFYFQKSLRDLTENRYCYTINIFIPFENRVVLWTGDPSIFYNHLDMYYPVKDSEDLNSIFGRERDIIVKRTKNLDNEIKFFLDRLMYENSNVNAFSIRQTLLFLFYRPDYYIEYQIQALQDNKKWIVIVVADSSCTSYRKMQPGKNVGNIIPFYRLILYDNFNFMQNLREDRTFRGVKIPFWYSTPLPYQLISNLLKNPDFDRFERYLSLPPSKSFNITCFKNFKTLNFKATIANGEVFLPALLRIFKYVNEDRMEHNRPPMRMILIFRSDLYYDYSWYFETAFKRYFKSIQFISINNFYVKAERPGNLKENIYFLLNSYPYFNRMSSENTRIFCKYIESWYIYAPKNTKLDELCKGFRKDDSLNKRYNPDPDDLFDLMCEDACSWSEKYN